MLRPYVYMIKIKLLLAFNYRFEVLFGLLAKLLILCATVFFWRAAYHNINSVRDVSENQMIVYSVLSVILSSLFDVSVEGNIRGRIRKGSIAVDYIKPVRMFAMYFCEDLGNSVSSMVITAVPVLAVSSIFFINPLPASPLHLMLFLPSVCLSYGILWLMSALFGLLYFWLIDIGPLGYVKDYIILILSGSFVPVWLFPQSVQLILKFLPFIYTYQLPLSVYIGKASPGEALNGMAVQALWVAVFGLLFTYLKKRVEKKVLVQGGLSMTVIKKIRRYLTMAAVYSKFNVQSGLEYPAYLLGWIVSNAFQFIFGLVTLKVVTTNFQALAGWSYEQMVFLYGLGIISHGLSIVFFIQTWHMDYAVTEGEFDRLLTRPLGTFFQFSFSTFNFVGFTDMIPGIIIFIYGCVSVGFSFTLLNVVKVLLVLVGATLLRGGIFTIIGSLSFWLKRTNQLIDVSLEMFDASMKYPISIYPRTLQAILTFFIPIGFICFYPASEFLGVDTAFHIPGGLCLWTLAVGIAVYAAGILLYHLGMRAYESAGS